MSIADKLASPDVLAAAATLAALAPSPVGPFLSAALRLVEVWLRTGKSITEVNAIVSRYSKEAQNLADDWHG